MKKTIIKYLITIFLASMFTLTIILAKNCFGQTNQKDIYHILTDAFFSPGVCVFGFGLIVVASNGGTFDMLSFGMRKLFDLFKRDLSDSIKETFYDYRQAKQEHPASFWYLIFVGFAFIAISMIFLILYKTC